MALELSSNQIAVRDARTEIALQPEKQQAQLLAITQMFVLAEARQASFSKETLILYARALQDVDERDLRRANEILCKTPRREGQTAFPDLGSVLEVVDWQRRERQGRERDQARIDADVAEKADRALHPENYVPVRDIFAGVMKSKGFSMDRKASPVISAPTIIDIPQCLRCQMYEEFTPTDLRQLADFRERRAEAATDREAQKKQENGNGNSGEVNDGCIEVDSNTAST